MSPVTLTDQGQLQDRGGERIGSIRLSPLFTVYRLLHTQKVAVVSCFNRTVKKQKKEDEEGELLPPRCAYHGYVMEN